MIKHARSQVFSEPIQRNEDLSIIVSDRSYKRIPVDAPEKAPIAYPDRRKQGLSFDNETLLA